MVVMPGIGVDQFDPMDRILKYSQVSVTERMGLYHQNFLMIFPEEITDRLSDHIGMGTQPGFIDIIDKIIVVVIAETHL